MDSMEASLRYPMDFTFHLQNFSAINYVKNVKGKQQATVAYSFIPADAFAGRPIGLTVNLHYRDAAGNFFIDPVFNETVQIVEFDEGFDTETFFMYVCIFGAAVLLLFLAFNFLSGKRICEEVLSMTFLLQERKVVPDPSQWRQEQTRMTWTLSGFPNPICVLQAQGRQVPDRGNQSVGLVLTLNNDQSQSPESDLVVNKDSDLQQIQSDYDYLTVNGHEIWITDFIVSLDIICIQAGAEPLLSSGLGPGVSQLGERSQAEKVQPSV